MAPKHPRKPVNELQRRNKIALREIVGATKAQTRLIILPAPIGFGRKTVAAAACLSKPINDKKKLIVVPSAMRRVWREIFRKIDPKADVIVHQTRDLTNLGKNNVTIISEHLIFPNQDLAKLLVPFSIVVYDETYNKKWVRKLRDECPKSSTLILIDTTCVDDTFPWSRLLKISPPHSTNKPTKEA